MSTSTTEVESWFSEALAALARGGGTTFQHLLHEHETPLKIENTSTTVRTHFLAIDVNGSPTVEKLAAAMANSVVDFCIPRTRIEQAQADFTANGSTAALVRLATQARELFVKAEKSGEGGELLLFLLMEQLLGLPQLLSKMSLKTSSNMHVHGSDGIHAKFGDDGVLDLYWGESKLYKSSSDAFKECFSSIAPFLLPSGTDARRRDLLLIQDHLNVTQQNLAAYLIKYFDDETPQSLDVRWNGVCLVGFDHARYPNLKQLNKTQSAELAKGVSRWHSTVADHLDRNQLLEVHIDIFCVPFPSVGEMRKAVSNALGINS